MNRRENSLEEVMLLEIQNPKPKIKNLKSEIQNQLTGELGRIGLRGRMIAADPLNLIWVMPAQGQLIGNQTVSLCRGTVFLCISPRPLVKGR